MRETIYYDLRQVPGLTPSLSTDVAGKIGRHIVSETYAQGDLIEDEGAVAERYRVSRSVIRDAVKILVGKGLLDDDVLAWFLSAPPNADFLRQLMDTRLVFEPKASRWAADRASEDEVTRIETAIERMESETGSIEDYVIADAIFHRSILRATHNEFLGAMEGLIFSALLGNVRLTKMDPREDEGALRMHREIYELIAVRKGGAAERVMEKLLEDARRRLGGRLQAA